MTFSCARDKLFFYEVSFLVVKNKINSQAESDILTVFHILEVTFVVFLICRIVSSVLRFNLSCLTQKISVIID
jgi:hypothetical protein